MNPPPVLESDAFLEHLNWCNHAVSDCLGLPLDPVNGADKYERNSKALANPSLWPKDAESKAKKYRNEFPWLHEIFVAKSPGAKCPVWEHTAELLAPHPKFVERLAERTGKWSHRSRTKNQPKKSKKRKKKLPVFDPKKEAIDEFGYVAWEMVRIVIGKASEWLAEWKARVAAGEVKTGESWLDLALDFGRSEIVRPIRQEGTGRKHYDRDKTTATQDPIPGERTPGITPVKKKIAGITLTTYVPASQAQNKKVISQTDLKRHEEESAVERPPHTDQGEQPDVLALTRERETEIARNIATLNDVEQDVVRMRFWELMSFPKIDKEMEWDVGTAKKIWQTAENKLRRCLPRDFPS
jgi:hypothetical protein